MAEEEGFEPSVQVSSHGHLANDWFQPLTHSSINKIIFYKTYLYIYQSGINKNDSHFLS
jgi:hypothetical protein